MVEPLLPMALPPCLGPLRERAAWTTQAELLDLWAEDCDCSAVCLADCMAIDCPVRGLIE